MTRALVGLVAALGLLVAGAQLAHYEDRERAQYHVARAVRAEVLRLTAEVAIEDAAALADLAEAAVGCERC